MPVIINGTTGIDKVQDGVIVQADLASGVAGTGPAFSAKKSAAQSINNATFTKIVFDAENIDTANNYDTSTGLFTPTVAGYYQFNTSVSMGGQTTQSIAVNLYKNGAFDTYLTIASANSNGVQAAASAMVYCNGTTDNVAIYVWQNSGGALNVSTNSFFQGFLARAA